MKIVVFRLGHRIFRDQRISSHVFLVARAFGASEGIYSGERDKGMENSIKNIVKQWGGDFKIDYSKTWLNTIKTWSGRIVHLTVYGMPLNKKITEIRKTKSLMVIVGGEKVPSDVYKIADWNVSVTSQPHSEISGLAIFLHEYFKGKEKKFKNAKIKVIPQERGKKVIKL